MMAVNLRDYQIDISMSAAECLRQNMIAYLAMETRTGKTLTAFNTIALYGAKNVLFVTKKKAIKSVESDYQHYRDLFRCDVINYESVLKMPGGYDLVVCDEAHGLSAMPRPAKRVKDMLKFTKGLPIIYLSATPTPENFSQIYHQLYISSFSPFRQYRNFYKWAHEFVNIKKKKVSGVHEINDYSDAKIELIEPYIKPLMFTQTQVGAGFTETITEKVLKVPMTEVQSKIIATLLKDRIVTGQSGAVVLGDTGAKMASKIHQLCSGTVKDEDGNGHIITRSKAVYIKEYFAGQKIAVFYKFQAEFEMLKQVFDNWTESPEEFQASADKTFFGQFQSAREGIRLDTADAIVFVNIDFSYISYAQSKDRIVSKERTKPAILYWVFSDNGIEEKIMKVVRKKKDFTLRHFRKEYL